MQNPLVSIIIPCFNAEKHLHETVNSIVKQHYHNWECIIINDHSTDRTPEIAKKYSYEHPDRFKYKINSRKGACAARNEGLRVAKGEYIQFLDADDLLSEDKIQKQILQLASEDAFTISNCAWAKFTNIGEAPSPSVQATNKNYSNPKQWLSDSWFGEGMSLISTWLTSRKLINLAGAWDEELLINQDGEYFCRVLLNANKIEFVEDCMVYYRQSNPKSISKQKSFEVFQSQLNSYLKYKCHIQRLDQTTQDLMLPALGAQLSDYYIRMKLTYPSLAYQAVEELKKLNMEPTPQGGRLFKNLSRFFGLDNAIKIRTLLTLKK